MVGTFSGLRHITIFRNTKTPVYPVIFNTAVMRDHSPHIFRLNCTNDVIIPKCGLNHKKPPVKLVFNPLPPGVVFRG